MHHRRGQSVFPLVWNVRQPGPDFVRSHRAMAFQRPGSSPRGCGRMGGLPESPDVVRGDRGILDRRNLFLLEQVRGGRYPQG